MDRRLASTRRSRIVELVLSLVALAAVVAPATAGARSMKRAASTQLNVRVAQGMLHGKLSHGARAFLDIPYAAPPVYKLRFAAPHAAAHWRGVRQARTLGPACIQFQFSGIRNTTATNEDCLNLDVYTPRGARPGAKLPVLFWMHGGANTQGTGIIYGGQRFATLTHSVMVSINYRLGAYGFLALKQLATRDGVGNYGLLDQLAALRWVKRNIARFGGNPHDITIDGQSAGSGAVCNMLASPLARGLFQRGILESGPCNSRPGFPAATAEALSRKFAREVGCTASASLATCLRHAWTGDMVAAEQKVVISSAVTGTKVLPMAPAKAIRTGHWNKVPLIVGSVRHEAKLFDIADANMTAAQYRSTIRTEWGRHASAVLAHYPLSQYPKPFYALAAIDTDSGNACYSWWLAAETGSQTATWEEEFNDPTSPTLFGFQPRGIDMSSAHSAELPYLWNFTLSFRPLTATERALGNEMDRYWGQFAQAANPDVSGQVSWPRATAESHPVIALRPTGNTVLTTTFPAEHQCGFWATVEPRTY